MTRVLAPGKVMLFGEYAVLDGSEALVVAVDRHVVCSVRPSEQLSILGLGVSGYTTPTPVKSPFLEAVIESLGVTPAEFVVDSRAFHAAHGPSTPQKLGLGSSAAVTVAFTLALARATGIRDLATPEQLYSFAQTIHHRVQGLGSGADIAGICFGGAIAYRWISNEADCARVPKDAEALPSEFGQGICTRLPSPVTSVSMVWSGQSANTRQLVRSVRSARRADPEGYAACMARIEHASQRGIQGWLAADREQLMVAATDAKQALTALGRLASVDLVTDRHHQLQDIASQFGTVVKPTGAGGGDLAWLVGPTVDAEAAALDAFRREHIPVWTFNIDRNGARQVRALNA
ncbi:MAG: hypothetical protein VX589_16035 [Myxococcota bacterium]|nr:hypothetical protein [Myxococcota bacterium]